MNARPVEQTRQIQQDYFGLADSIPQEGWYWAAMALIAGYVLQYVGHRVEGNDVGEWAAIKRLLGLPYVSISPRWQRP